MDNATGPTRTNRRAHTDTIRDNRIHLITVWTETSGWNGGTSTHYYRRHMHDGTTYTGPITFPSRIMRAA